MPATMGTSQFNHNFINGVDPRPQGDCIAKHARRPASQAQGKTSEAQSNERGNRTSKRPEMPDYA